MKLKEYLNSLVSRKKKSTSPKTYKPTSHHQSISSADCHYEICGYEDIGNVSTETQPSRTEVLLSRHAHLVDTIVGIRSQENLSSSCSHCRMLHPSHEQTLPLPHTYSSTLATCNPHRENQNQTTISSSNNSLWTNVRQRSKIRTNPWIQTTRTFQPEYSIYEPIKASTLIHSESFPQTISNVNMKGVKQSNKILHHSDSGHGFSLTSSRAIDSSSSDNTSSDGPSLDDKQHTSYMNPNEQYLPVKPTICSARKRRLNKIIQARYTNSSNIRVPTPIRPMNRNPYSNSVSPRLVNDRFSMEFEEIVENEYSPKQQSPPQRSPFILPLDSTTLQKTNSRTILKHIQEIENEIQMIKNLNFGHDSHILSSAIFAQENEQQSIHEKVDQWVEECLTTNQNHAAKLLHTELNHLSNTMQDYVGCVCPNDDDKISSSPQPEKDTEVMTAFYLTTLPMMKRRYSSIDQFVQPSDPEMINKDVKFMHESPF